jgi:hypothetical protein
MYDVGTEFGCWFVWDSGGDDSAYEFHFNRILNFLEFRLISSDIVETRKFSFSIENSWRGLTGGSYLLSVWKRVS